MWIAKLAWRNLWRNKSRTLITISAIYFAVMLSILAESLKEGIFENLIKNVVSIYTGYIQIHKKGYQHEQILDNSIQESVIMETKIKSLNNIVDISPRLESFGLASSSTITKGCMIIGINPKIENNITSLKNKIIKGEYINNDDKSVMVTQGLAERLNLTVNDTIILIGQGYHGITSAGKYPVKALLKFGSPQLNEKTLYLTLASAQDFFGAPNLITSYVVATKNIENINVTAQKIRKITGTDKEVLTWEEIIPEIKQHIATDSNNMKVVQGILYLLICFGIFSTLLMMMMERKFEMGLLVAIGMKKSKLILLFIYESILTVSIGCLVGIISSFPLVFYLNKHPIKMRGEAAKAYERFGFEAIFPTSTNFSIFVFQTIVILVIGLLMSIYPTIKVIRLKVIESMRK